MFLIFDENFLWRFELPVPNAHGKQEDYYQRYSENIYVVYFSAGVHGQICGLSYGYYQNENKKEEDEQILEIL